MNIRGQRRRQSQQDNIKFYVEDLPPVDTTGLLERVRAAIYLSLDELWSILTDNTLIATFLDPRFKHFNWTTNDEREKVYQLVKLYIIT
ncbi:12737_t:CDS:2 [Funneliformis geosporum]|uniref:12737_t:CDS:1 n=1 Tax=Funneliformis geosporum TaxID=1117311 RepID=A0A9W4SYF0_9GLOM|nr:12737_t:CDS:2 [Funneliformis geosporum]